MDKQDKMANTPAANDVRKMGYLKKMKTMKRKYFILRDESPGGPARLEYYDTEKKFKASSVPKRSIILDTCFNISKKSDAKHRHAITLYTKDECFAVVCDSEEDQDGWLSRMLELQLKDQPDGDTLRPYFEHIWQVTVKPRGLCNGRPLCNGRTLNQGSYRLCLTNKTVSLMRLNQSEPDVIYQLGTIRRCGHSDCFFFMEVGRSAITGAGELWMQVEDTIIAQNMHEAILSSMKNNAATEQPPTGIRQRTRSSASERGSAKAIHNKEDRGNSPSFDSQTLPKRSRTITSVDYPSSPRTVLRPQSKSSTTRPNTVAGYGKGPSPIASSPLSLTMLSESHRSRTDSMESRGTASSLSNDEFDISPGSGATSTRSVTPEISTKDLDYLSMEAGSYKDSTSDTNATPYMDMEVRSSSCNEMTGGYMDMSPSTTQLGNDYFDMSGSPALSSTGSLDQDRSGYLEMSAKGALPTVQEKIHPLDCTDDPLAGSLSPSTASCPKPDKVYSYLSDDTGDSFPKRCYSVGSKPVSQNKPLDQSYMAMESPGQIDKTHQKSSSAPHLMEQELEKAKTARHSLMGGDHSDLFMEMDFFGKNSSTHSLCSNDGVTRPRAGSGGSQMRNRTSSFGQEHAQKHRRRAASFGKEGLLTRPARGGTTSGGSVEGHRPRVATICQDTFRPRTSSFQSPPDMRPRSSSHGNAHYKFRRSARDSMGVESLLKKATSQRASQESIKSGASVDYMDMSPKLSASPSEALTATFKTAAERERLDMLRRKEEESAYIGMSPVNRLEDPSKKSMTLNEENLSEYCNMSFNKTEPTVVKASTNPKQDNSSAARSKPKSPGSVDLLRPVKTRSEVNEYMDLDPTKDVSTYVLYEPEQKQRARSRSPFTLDKVSCAISEEKPSKLAPSKERSRSPLSNVTKEEPEYENISHTTQGQQTTSVLPPFDLHPSPVAKSPDIMDINVQLQDLSKNLNATGLSDDDRAPSPNRGHSSTGKKPHEGLIADIPISVPPIVVEEKELNYASLDLGGTTEESRNGSEPEDSGASLQYAQIDFAKSESLKKDVTLQEKRLSFEFKK